LDAAIVDRNMLVSGPPGTPVRGYLVFREEGSRLHLENLAVAPAWRRRGVGRSLLDRCLELGRSISVARASLEVRASNSGARALYTAAGFTAVGRLPGYYRSHAAGLSADAIVYECDLRPKWSSLSLPAQGDSQQ
jgi:ribosomal protein S18 acetylase RimI-like enzyme